MEHQVKYVCGGSSHPSPAEFVCCQPTCAVYPFMCNAGDCSCRSLHAGHHRQQLSLFLNELASTQLANEQQFAADQQEISKMLEAMRSALDNLVKSHSDYLTSYSEGFQLRDRLLSGKPLQEPSGDSMGRLLAERKEVANSRIVGMAGRQLLEELGGISSEFNGMLYKLSTLWKRDGGSTSHKFHFSEQLKANTIDIKENGKSAQIEGSYGVVLLQPSLPTAYPSRVQFKIGSKDWMALGIGFTSHLERQNYQPDINGASGMYLMFDDMRKAVRFNDGLEKDEECFQFEQNDVVAVEFNPKQATLTFSLKGKQKQYRMLLHKQAMQYLGQVYFGVYLDGMHRSCSVSLT